MWLYNEVKFDLDKFEALLNAYAIIVSQIEDLPSLNNYGR